MAKTPAPRQQRATGIDIVRAWKDAKYRNGLSLEQRAGLPENPVGNPPKNQRELSAVLQAERSFITLGGPKRCGTKYPECCYNSTVGPKTVARKQAY